jgi:hypothetical protein
MRTRQTANLVRRRSFWVASSATTAESSRTLVPGLVICGETTEVVRENIPVWIELYPRHEAYSVVSIEGKRKEYALMELSDLLSIVDQAKGLAR